MKYAYQQSSGESRSMTFKADKPVASGGGDFAVRTSEVLAGDDRTLPDQLREAEAQRDTAKRERDALRDCGVEFGACMPPCAKHAEEVWNRWHELIDTTGRIVQKDNVIIADWRERAEAAERKVDEYRQQEREWDSFTQMAEEELGKRNNRIAALESALALAKELWGTVPEEVFAKIDRARDALREEQPRQ